MNVEKSVFYSRLKYLCENEGKSINGVEKLLGYPRNALHNYKDGQAPSGLRLIELSDYFGVSPEYLIGKDSVPTSSPTQMTLFFRMLDKSQKEELYDISKKWYRNQNEKMHSSRK